jgi:hypothetical protein
MALSFTVQDIQASSDDDLKWFARNPSYKGVAMRELAKRAEIKRAKREAELAEREARKATLCFDFVKSGNVVVNGKPMSYDRAWMFAHVGLSLTAKNQWNNTERFPEIAEVQRGAKRALAELTASFKFNGLEWSNAKNPARIVTEHILLGKSLEDIQAEVQVQIALDRARNTAEGEIVADDYEETDAE